MSAATDRHPDLEPRARAFALRLFAAVRILRGHGSSNDAFGRLEAELVGEARILLKLGGGELDLRLHDDLLLVNGAVVPPTSRKGDRLGDLSTILLESDVGGIAFDFGFEEPALGRWLRLVSQGVEDERALTERWRALDGLASAGLRTARFRELQGSRLAVADVSADDFALGVLARAVVCFAEYVRAVEEDRPPARGALGVDPLVRDVVDLVSARPDRLSAALDRSVGLEASGRFTVEAWHAARVLGRSVVMGSALGLDRVDLLELGRAALLARVGHGTMRPFRTLPSPKQEARRIAAARDRALALLGRLGLERALALVVAYEHEEGGYGTDRRIHPLSRIVAVAHRFEGLRAGRDGRAPMPVAEALRMIDAEIPQGLDPAAAAALRASL